MENISTFVISLQYPEKLLCKLLHDHNIDATLFNAIDGQQVSNKIIEKNFTKLYSYFGPKSSIGCGLSHLNVWKTFLKSDKEYAVVFEDDIILENVQDLSNTIPRYIKKTPNDFDILYLGSFGSENTPNFFTTAMYLLNMRSTYHKINDHICKPQVALAMHSYVISKRGAAKLVKLLNGRIHNHIDYCIQNLYSKGLLNNYITTPRLLYQSSTNRLVSTNVSNMYPILVNKILSNFYLDKYVKTSYITTVSVFRIGNLNFTISTIFIIILSLIFLYVETDINSLLLFIILLSLPDLLSYQMVCLY
jgi:GR25 family glycosyltransferase involved in LPS biosynthesis